MAQKESGEKQGFRAMVRDAVRFVRSTRLIRGLLIGMVGAFAAAGALVGSARTYADSLRGGESTFGLLLVAMFVGLATGMAGSPKLAQRLPHNRLFGIAIVVAGLALGLVALSPHLVVSLITVMVVGACAGAAFLTGVTIIGTQIEDAIRGRINAIYQSLMKIILAGSIPLTPLLIGLVQPHNIIVWGRPMRIDGSRPVLLAAGLIAALVGVIAYRQMDDRRTEPILADLLNAIRRKPRRSTTGLLVAVEGDTVADTSMQAHLLADWMKRPGTKEVLLATDPALDDQRLQSVLSGAQLTGARAHALVAAAVRADIVERQIRPALDRGALVVMERFVDSPLAHLSAVAGLDPVELEGLADWATARLRPDVTILLDRDPSGLEAERSRPPEHHWHVQKVLTEMAAADPDRYVVVDADGTPEQVAVRVRIAVQTALAGRRQGSLLPSDSLAPVKVPVVREAVMSTVWSQVVGQPEAVEVLTASADGGGVDGGRDFRRRLDVGGRARLAVHRPTRLRPLGGRTSVRGGTAVRDGRGLRFLRRLPHGNGRHPRGRALRRAGGPVDLGGGDACAGADLGPPPHRRPLAGSDHHRRRPPDRGRGERTAESGGGAAGSHGVPAGRPVGPPGGRPGDHPVQVSSPRPTHPGRPGDRRGPADPGRDLAGHGAVGGVGVRRPRRPSPPPGHGRGGKSPPRGRAADPAEPAPAVRRPSTAPTTWSKQRKRTPTR